MIPGLGCLNRTGLPIFTLTITAIIAYSQQKTIMKTGTKNRQIANAYYNIGLEKARSRDLSGAVTALKKSLRFDKYQTDARNLLGLIYNEIGEVGAASASRPGRP